MEVGSLRKRIIVALLIYVFGEENVEANLPITEPEADVKVFSTKMSIKTISHSLGGVKLIWTVDRASVLSFQANYKPSCDMLLVLIKWNKEGYVYFIPKEIQEEILKKLGRDKYIKLPKQGTNPRGVEISGQALKILANHPNTQKILVNWERKSVKFNPFERWVDLWKK